MNDGTCNTVPVFEGFALFHSILQSDIGGADVSAIFGETALKGQKLPPKPYGGEIVSYMKEKYCFACPSRADFLTMLDRGGSAAAAAASSGDFGAAQKAGGLTVRHELPDGEVLTMGAALAFAVHLVAQSGGAASRVIVSRA